MFPPCFRDAITAVFMLVLSAAAMISGAPPDGLNRLHTAQRPGLTTSRDRRGLLS
jgi:hypothetical protein